MPIVEQLQADREKQLERQKTIEENIGLVHACAHRFQGKGIEYDDLFQAGCMGLVKATDAFDTGRGVRFSTYAVPVILGEMRRLFRDGGTVKVSRSLKELGMKLNRCREQFAREHGREATITELAQQLQVTQEAVVEALDGLPTHKIHCSVLAEEAVKAAVKDYYDRNNISYDAALFVEGECPHCHE